MFDQLPTSWPLIGFGLGIAGFMTYVGIAAVRSSGKHVAHVAPTPEPPVAPKAPRARSFDIKKIDNGLIVTFDTKSAAIEATRLTGFPAGTRAYTVRKKRSLSHLTPHPRNP